MRNKSHGFTLLEILIALFIFTIVSLIIVTGLRTVLHSQAATEYHAKRLTALETTVLLLSRDLEQTVNRPIINNKNAIESFIGTDNDMSFTHAGLSNPRGALQRSTLQRTEYLLNNHQLIRVTWPVLDRTSKTQADQRILLSDVKELHFEYLNDKNQFQNKWEASDKIPLPKAVRVTLLLDHWGKLTQTYLLPSGTTIKDNTSAPKTQETMT